jgi:hypothetical protein
MAFIANLESGLAFVDEGLRPDPGGLGVTPDIDPGDVSGGAPSPSVAQAAEQIEEYAAEGGGSLAIVYGRHVVAGNELARAFTPGTPNVLKVFVALCEGQGNLGQHGECEEAEEVFYAGEPLSVSPDGSTAGYRFHNGFISTGVASGPQQVDAFLPSGLAYSGTCYIAVKLPDAIANAEQRPDKLKALIKGRRVNTYDGSGNITATNVYSVNPAYIAVDRIRAYYEHKYRNDIALAQRKLLDKVDWESLAAWAQFNATNISWDDGTTVRSIPRFECHIAFTSDLTLADALDQITASCGAWWQDDGERIIFIPPSDQTPIHHFDESNIVGDPRAEPRDLRDRPNVFVAKFRDLDDEFLGFASTPPVRALDLIRQVGEIKVTRTVPNMTLSQAMRLADRWKRLECDNPIICTLVGDESSTHVLPGRFVMVSHSALDWNYQLCLVLSADLASGEDAPDICNFTLQRIDDALYSDLAHGPRQEALTP